MVQTRRSRPRRRPPGATPARRRGALGKRPSRPVVKRYGDATPTRRRLSTPRYPNMQARREWDRQQHVERAIAMGATRKQAQRHAAREIMGREW